MNQILAARLRNRWIMAPTPSTRHLLDGVAVPVPPLDGASPSAFSTVQPTQCDFHTGDKHMAIINKILATHSEHILEFSDFLDSRYKSMMRELCKQPEDIEGTVTGVLLRFHAIDATRLRQRRRFGAVSGDAPAPRLAQAPRLLRSTLQT